MAKIFSYSAVILLCSILVQCRSASGHYLVGTWDMPSGKQVMIFHKDSSMLWIFNENVVPDTFHLKYRVDETKSPNRIDLYNFRSGILKGKALAGILDHKSKDSIMLDFRPIESWAEADSARPKEFSPATFRMLVKVK